MNEEEGIEHQLKRIADSLVGINGFTNYLMDSLDSLRIALLEKLP